jgi:hypothetical protein
MADWVTATFPVGCDAESRRNTGSDCFHNSIALDIESSWMAERVIAHRPDAFILRSANSMLSMHRGIWLYM